MSEDAPYTPHVPHRVDPAHARGATPPSPFVSRSPEARDFEPSTPPPPAATPPPRAVAADALATPRPDLRESVVEVLQRIYDPEIPVNIYDLGLVYGVDVTPEGSVEIQMTLTSPSCPVAETLPPEVEQKVRLVDGVTAVRVNLVWEPPWGKHLLSEAARLQLGMD